MSGGPVFILGLQRSGTSQLLNVLRSHPDTTWPDGELHEVLRPNRRLLREPVASARTLCGYLPMVLRLGDALNPHRPPAGPLSARERAWVAAVLRRATRRNRGEVARYKREIAARGLYPNGGGSMDRMVVKLVNYNVALAEDLLRTFPDARFVGLVREAVGVCESMISRGAAPEKAVRLYAYLGEKLLRLQETGFPVTVLRFEDLLADIRAASADVYRFCRLDPAATAGLCLQDKQRVTDGAGRVVGTRKVEVFDDFDGIGAHLRADVNAAAKARLSPELRRRIAGECRAVMARLGYSGGGEPA